MAPTTKSTKNANLPCGEEEQYSEETIKINGNLIEAFEVVEDEASGKVRIYHRIVTLKVEPPETDPTDNNNNSNCPGDSDHEESDNDIIADDSFFDALLFGCVGCEPCVNGLVPRSQVKSILKKGTLSKSLSPEIQHSMTTRTVSFSSIDIKEFKMTLGDHPSATSGPPVRLDWNSKPTIDRVVSLDEFEQMRQSQRRKRKELKIPYKDRKSLLLDERGFTPDEVNSAWNEALKIRQQRYETLQHGVSPHQINMDAFVESIQRKYNRLANNVLMPSVSFS